MIDWLKDNWLKVVIPLIAFLATTIVGLWFKRFVDKILDRWKVRTKWEGSHLVITMVRRQVLPWFLLLGIVIATQVSELTANTKTLIVKIIGSLFVLFLGWGIIVLSEQLLRLYLLKTKAPQPTTAIVINIVRITLIIVVALILLDIWGAPITPVLLLIAVIVLVAAFIFRNSAPNFFAGFQLSTSQQLKVGDYIKLETGEEGHIIEMGWNNTRLRVLDESVIVIPNSRLTQHKVINYGRPLKKAEEPFRFYVRSQLTELTGLKAKNLQELIEVMRKVPDAVIHYHTHRFLEEHHYLTPEPANDFGIWVSDALGDEALGERLASVNTFEFTNLGTLRERLIGIIEEQLAKRPDSREAMTGREFYFIKSVSVILPTPYAAHDLREFAEILRKISLSSLYFHIFESRLRLGKGLNDFSVWMKDRLDEEQLGEEITRLDPYTYTLEALRLTLIQLIEKRIK